MVTSFLAWRLPNPGSFGPLAALTGMVHPMMRGDPLVPMAAHIKVYDVPRGGGGGGDPWVLDATYPRPN